MVEPRFGRRVCRAPDRWLREMNVSVCPLTLRAAARADIIISSSRTMISADPRSSARVTTDDRVLCHDLVMGPHADFRCERDVVNPPAVGEFRFRRVTAR